MREFESANEDVKTRNTLTLENFPISSPQMQITAEWNFLAKVIRELVEMETRQSLTQREESELDHALANTLAFRPSIRDLSMYCELLNDDNLRHTLKIYTRDGRLSNESDYEGIFRQAHIDTQKAPNIQSPYGD